MPSGGALKYCDKCYKNEIGETFNELLKINQEDKNKLQKNIKYIKEKYQLNGITNLKINTKVNILGTISSKEYDSEILKDGKKLRLAKFIIKDDSGKILLTLWNNLIDKIEIGRDYIIKNGFVSEWNLEKYVTLGKLGKIYVIK